MMLVVGHRDAADLLAGRELDVVGLVRDAYRSHGRGRTAVPFSSFLRFPDSASNRIIALPAYLDGPEPVAGIKWVASFPENLDRGVARASALVVLNSVVTGQPVALVEGSMISAWRTAASAALAASLLGADGRDGVTLFGCGAINLEILRFLSVLLPGLRKVMLFDRDPARAASFAERAGALWPDLVVSVAADPETAVGAAPLVSLATTAVSPHLRLDGADPDAVVLHVSLRDLYPETILTCRNVVDDLDHVMREGTSVWLAERVAGNRDFVDATICDLVLGKGAVRAGRRRPVVFSPFGLGVLDIALARYVLEQARRAGRGDRVADFLPAGASPLAPPSPALTKDRSPE